MGTLITPQIWDHWTFDWRGQQRWMVYRLLNGLTSRLMNGQWYQQLQSNRFVPITIIIRRRYFCSKWLRQRFGSNPTLHGGIRLELRLISTWGGGGRGGEGWGALNQTLTWPHMIWLTPALDLTVEDDVCSPFCLRCQKWSPWRGVHGGPVTPRLINPR